MTNEERKAVIDAAIPKEHRPLFYRLIRDGGFKVRIGNTSGPFSRNKPTRPLQPSQLFRAITIFTSMIQWGNYNQVSSEAFINAITILNQNPDNEVIYSELTPSAQKFFINLPKKISQRKEYGYIYLNLLNRLESLPDYSIMQALYQLPHHRSSDSPETIAEILIIALEQTKTNAASEGISTRYDLTPPSKRLVTLMQEQTPPAFNILDFILIDVLFMWKMLYGESAVIDFYEKFREYPRMLNDRQMFSILDDWSNLETYPAEWIMSVK